MPTPLPPGVKTIRVNDHDMAYVESGAGAPLVLVHGSLSDYRNWATQMGPLGERRRVIAVSLRRYYPERWDGVGAFSWRFHVEDLAAFIAALGAGAVDLVGHSRGGYVATRLALARPELINRLVLAEPGLPATGILGPAPDAEARAAEMAERWRRTAEMIAAGKAEEASQFVVDSIGGPGSWAGRDETLRQMVRDNLNTVIGESRDTRAPVTPADAATIRHETLLVGGALSPKNFGAILSALEAALPNARRVTIPKASHGMNRMNPAAFNAAVGEFLAGG